MADLRKVKQVCATQHQTPFVPPPPPLLLSSSQILGSGVYSSGGSMSLPVAPHVNVISVGHHSCTSSPSPSMISLSVGSCHPTPAVVLSLPIKQSSTKSLGHIRKLHIFSSCMHSFLLYKIPFFSLSVVQLMEHHNQLFSHYLSIRDMTGILFVHHGELSPLHNRGVFFNTFVQPTKYIHA